MNPTNDLVCSLLETPFSRWKEKDKKDLFKHGRPQPVLSLVKTSGDKNKPNSKTFVRKFKSRWYIEHKWLCGSSYLQKLYCWPCLLIGAKMSAWNRNGIGDLNNITRAFRKHESSMEHLKNCVGFKALEKKMNKISDALKESSRLNIIKHNKSVRLNRLLMHYPIRAALFLSRQEMAFRGHNEGEDSLNRGNFKELLDSYIEGSPIEIQNHYSNTKAVFAGNSKMIQNEITECISHYIKSFIYEEINETAFFSVQVDDISDMTQKSQCSLILRYLDPSGSVVERFMGFYDISKDRTADVLFHLLDGTLSQFDYKSKLVGQCYDGAAVLAGHLNGLQKRIKDVAPQAVFVHCLAHRLNLVLRQSFDRIQKCRTFFANIDGIPGFFHHSCQWAHILQPEIRRRMTSATDVRWSSLAQTLKVIGDEWDGIIRVLKHVMENCDPASVCQAEGFLNKFNDFEFAFLALVFKEIFELTHTLFNVLQKKSLDIGFCVNTIQNTEWALTNKRNDDTFKIIIEASLLKVGTPPIKENMSEDEYFQDLKLLFYEILDSVMLEINERFSDVKKLTFLKLADTSQFPAYSETFPTDALDNLKFCYAKYFPETERLKNELLLIFQDETYRNMNFETLVRSLKESSMDEVFTEAYKLFTLILTIPSISCSAERNFSCLKRIKTYLGNSLCNSRLTSQPLISIHNDLLSEIMKTHPYYEDIIDAFAKLKNRKIDLIYKNNEGGDGKFEAGSSSQGTEILGLSDTVAKTEVEEAIYTSEPEYIIKNSPQSEDSPEEEFEPPEKQPRIPKIEEVYLPENQELEQHRSLESSDNTTSTKPPEADRDEFTVFGEYVTTTLRNLPNRYLQCVAKHKISEILFQIESQCYSALLTGNEQSAATHGSFSSQSLPSTSYAHQLSVSNIPTTH